MGVLTFVSDGAEDLFSDTDRCADRYRVGSLADLRRLLDAATADGTQRSLDLVGHSTRDAKLLRMGKTIVDMGDVRIRAFFEAIATSEVLSRLNITTVRLLGCECAVEPTGQRTIRALARTLRLPVYGARKSILKSYYNGAGFDPAFAHILIESAELPNPPRRLE